MSPKYLKVEKFQTKCLIHFTAVHKLLLPTRFSPRLLQLSKWHHPPTRHSNTHASNVGVTLDSFFFLTCTLHIQSFGKSYPFRLGYISQICPLLSISLAINLIQVIRAYTSIPTYSSAPHNQPSRY